MEQLTSVGRWKLEKTLGQGSYGVVKRAVHSHTKAKTAIKIVDTNKLKKPSERIALRREVSVHYTLKHPNVVEVTEVFERNGFIFIVMELLEGGDLFNHIVEKGKVEEEKGRVLFVQMLKALSYCHANSVVHRDLKLENFLINKDASTVKLTDFGFCNVMKSTDTLLDTYCGSPYYCAPEIFLAQKYDGRAADVWSLGVILYAMLTGSLPFVNPQGKVMFDKLMQADCPYPAHLSENSKALIKRMLQPTPSARPSIVELMQHPWIGDINLASPSVKTRPKTITPPATPPSQSPTLARANGQASIPTTMEKSTSNPTTPEEPVTTVLSPGKPRQFRSPKDKKKNGTLSGTWRKVTDMLTLQFFSKKDRSRDSVRLSNKPSVLDAFPNSDSASSSPSPSSSANSSTSSSSSTSSGGSSTSNGSSCGSASPENIIRTDVQIPL